MQLVSHLQSQGVKAEFLPKVAPSLNEQWEYANARGIRWLILLDGQSDVRTTQSFRIKSLDGKVESTMPLADVSRYLIQLGKR